MPQSAKPPQDRSQIVLFSPMLDEAIPADHVVRLLDSPSPYRPLAYRPLALSPPLEPG